MPLAPGSDSTAMPPGLNTRPLWLLYACAFLVIAILIGADLAASLQLRDSTLRNSEANLRHMSLALAEQADRSVQGVDLVLSSMAEFVAAQGADDAAGFQRKMASQRVHELLAEKLVGLPYINAVTMVDADGGLVNFSRYWPIPPVNVADRDYFQAMRDNPSLQRFISAPVRNRGNDDWTVFLARRVPSRDGSFAGLLLGAIDLKYFEDFYRSVSLGEGSAISLIRLDGVQLVRYPPAEVIGMQFPAGGPRALQGGTNGVIRDISPVDGMLRIKAAWKLTNFPLFVLVTQTEATALQAWRGVALVLGLVTAFCTGAILVAAVAIGRWWRQQQMLANAHADHAEAEHARAVAEADLAHERERHAEEANRAKSGFLATMSHEIRTPLNAVLGLAGSLLDGSLAPAQCEVVRAIRDAGDSLLRILNDILDYSKLDAGRMTFEAAPFSPATLTQNVISILGPRARAKGLAIIAEADPALPAGLLGDAGRIRQVLLNLVSNAVKFTDAGVVTIRARCIGGAGDTITVEWSVHDTGIGIAPDRIGSLFGEFVQADSTISRRFGGSGLGLAISKRLTEHMGGTIGVESAEGSGTTFRVRLTLPAAEAPTEVPSHPADRNTRPESAAGGARPAAAHPVRRGQPHQPVRRAANAQGPAGAGGRRRRRAGGGRRRLALCLRRDLHGHAHAGNGRPGGDQADPPARRRTGARADRRTDRECLPGGREGVFRRRHEPVRHQAGEQGRAVRRHPAGLVAAVAVSRAGPRRRRGGGAAGVRRGRAARAGGGDRP